MMIELTNEKLKYINSALVLSGQLYFCVIKENLQLF